jgi:aspartate/methionine/tyrosine aminotransferase
LTAPERREERSKKFLSARWEGFGGTVIGEVARLAKSRGAVDLALGSPEISPPEAVLRAAAEAILAGANQYTVAAIPGSAFYSRPENGASLLRFCFGKSAATLAAARERLSRLPRES